MTELEQRTTFDRPRRMRRLFPVEQAGPEAPARHPRPSDVRRSRAVRLAVLLLVASLAGGFTWMIRARKPPVARAPGQTVPDFAISDVRTGQVHRLSDHQGSVVAIVFTGIDCPIGELYLPRLGTLARRFEKRNVVFLAINSNASESAEQIAEHARLSAIPFPVLKDPQNLVADALLAERTCETLVIDQHGRLRYRGAIDDQYALGARRDEPSQCYLAGAIEALLAGKSVAPETTQVVGCPIERTRPVRTARSGFASASTSRAHGLGREPASLADRALAHPATYATDVAAILHSRCATCHHPGQVAPFPLLTFEQARRWAPAIAEAVDDRRMPPWHADPNHGRFANDRSLTDQERTVIGNWVEQGCPPGELAKAPQPPRFSPGWSIGTPDVVYEMADAFVVQAEGTLPIQRFRVPTNLTDDLWVEAAEIRPGDRAVVHHICVYVDDHTRRHRKGRRVKNLLVAYTPGDVPSIFPPGVAKKIPPESDLLFEVHYTPIGKSRFDRSTVGLIVSKKPPRHVARTRGIAGWGLRIPPQADDYARKASWTTDRDIHLLSLSPHMHLRGKSFEFVAQYPDGHLETLLSVPNYDFNWQSVYRLAEPKALPKGTLIQCEAHYDNSSHNPANPDPDKTVKWGEQTWDEMMIGFMDYYEDDPIVE